MKRRREGFEACLQRSAAVNECSIKIFIDLFILHKHLWMYYCKVTKTTHNITLSPYDTVGQWANKREKSFGENANSLKLFKILFNRFNKDDKLNHFHLHRSKINFCKIIFGIDFVILHTLLRGGIVFSSLYLSIVGDWALYLVSNLHNLTMLCCFYAGSFIYLS